MRSGAKNSVVQIHTIGETIDPDYNTSIPAPVVFRANVFCRTTPRRGRELEVEGQIRAESFVKFEFDYLDVIGVNETMTITHEGQVYGIRQIMFDHAIKDWIEIEAVANSVPTQRA